jgi:hypothetical protein
MAFLKDVKRNYMLISVQIYSYGIVSLIAHLQILQGIIRPLIVTKIFIKFQYNFNLTIIHLHHPLLTECTQLENSSSISTINYLTVIQS